MDIIIFRAIQVMFFKQNKCLARGISKGKTVNFSKIYGLPLENPKEASKKTANGDKFLGFTTSEIRVCLQIIYSKTKTLAENLAPRSVILHHSLLHY